MTKFKNTPQTICGDCIEKPPADYVAASADGDILAIFCKHNHAGAIYRSATGVWTCYSPVTADQFATQVSVLAAMHQVRLARDAEKRAASGGLN